LFIERNETFVIENGHNLKLRSRFRNLLSPSAAQIVPQLNFLGRMDFVGELNAGPELLFLESYYIRHITMTFNLQKMAGGQLLDETSSNLSAGSLDPCN